MITIGWCNYTHDESFSAYIKAFFNNDVEVIEKICNQENKKFISSAYNEILNEASNDIVLLLHNNVYFVNCDRYKMSVEDSLKHQFYNNPEFGIIGVFPRCTDEQDIIIRNYEPADYNVSECDGCGNIVNEFKSDELCPEYSLELIEDALIDGCLIAINKKVIKSGFCDDNKSFHFYDLDLCVANKIQGVKVGITKAFEILHARTQSEDSKSWDEYNKYKPDFMARWGGNLPIILSNRPKELVLLTAMVRPENIKKMTDSIVRFRDYCCNIKITWIICYDQYNLTKDISEAYRFCDENTINWVGYPSGKPNQKNYGGDMYNEALVWYRSVLSEDSNPWVYIFDDDNILCELMGSQIYNMLNRAEQLNKDCIWMSKLREDGFVDTVKPWSVFSKGKENHSTYADEFLPDPSQLIIRLSRIENFGYFAGGYSYDQHLWWYFYVHNDTILYPEDWLGQYWHNRPSNNIFQCYHDGITSKEDIKDIEKSIKNLEPVSYNIVIGRGTKIDRINISSDIGKKLIKMISDAD